MTVPKAIKLELIREVKRDCGFLILCLLFLAGRFLDVYTLIEGYYRWGLGREVFNPINNFFVRWILGLPRDWLGDYELSLLNSFVIYRFSISGFLILQGLLTTIILAGLAVLWKLSYHPGNTRPHTSRFLIKAVLYGLAVLSVLFAVVNRLAVLAISLDL